MTDRELLVQIKNLAAERLHPNAVANREMDWSAFKAIHFAIERQLKPAEYVSKPRGRVTKKRAQR